MGSKSLVNNTTTQGIQPKTIHEQWIVEQMPKSPCKRDCRSKEHAITTIQRITQLLFLVPRRLRVATLPPPLLPCMGYPQSSSAIRSQN
ncbi:hypothetical protein SK128_015682 [Halocaridina rubra]|uniref:Uncharacterized protein n=1 Tax=Halocaridina rubra TaxID=373956 RepID=A0AAN9A6N6_HALRR